jgi:hypothetical protein
MVFLFPREKGYAELASQLSSIASAKMMCKYEQFSYPAHMKFIVNILSHMTFTMPS